ncbi:MAG: response regulator [Polyangia bacterium]
MSNSPVDPQQRKRLEMFRGLAAERLTRLNLLWVQIEHGVAEPASIRELARELHTLKGEASLMGFAQVTALAHGLEDLLRPQLQGAAADPATGDLVLRGLDLIAAAIEDKGDTSADSGEFIDAVERARPELHAAAASPPESSAAGEPPGAASIPPLSAPRERQPLLRTADSVRVTSAKLDRVRDIIGELILTRSRLDLSAAEFRKARDTAIEQQELMGTAAGRPLRMLIEAITGIEVRLRDDSYRIADLVTELDEAMREVRMVPIQQLLQQYPVAVRELARELGKEVWIEFEGETIEVDRAVLDRLADPLLHLVRNAIDHGIETPAVRRKSGKRTEGKLTIRARLLGRLLEVAVVDDGAGINVEAVRARAVELGLLDATKARALTPEQVLRTLFYARMSTRREVTKVSGRGIGLDVVLSYVEGLGGTVSVHSTLGAGTTFLLSVPVSMAMTSIVLFEVGAARYALPATSVVALVEASSCPAVASIDGPAVRYSGEKIPLVALNEILREAPRGAPGVDRDEPQRLMIVSKERGLLALSGTSRHSEREVVSKSMGRFFERSRLINAAVPLEDGTLALMLSPGELLTRPRAARAGNRPSAPALHRRRTVLVVDDSPVVRDLLAEALRAHGLWVVEAGDGEDALAKLDAHPELDLVVSDVDMPRLDGIGLVQRIRQRGPRRMPVVIVSMRGSPEDQRRALDAGADAYLVKTDLSHAGLWTLLARFLE